MIILRGVDAVMSGPSTKEHSIDITITQGVYDDDDDNDDCNDNDDDDDDDDEDDDSYTIA